VYHIKQFTKDKKDIIRLDAIVGISKLYITKQQDTVFTSKGFPKDLNQCFGQSIFRMASSL
jgi:hypothetical protein